MIKKETSLCLRFSNQQLSIWIKSVLFVRCCRVISCGVRRGFFGARVLQKNECRMLINESIFVSIPGGCVSKDHFLSTDLGHRLFALTPHSCPR